MFLLVQNVRTHRGLEPSTALQIYALRHCCGKFEDDTRALLEHLTREQ
jgi:hypothetical protein